MNKLINFFDFNFIKFFFLIFLIATVFNVHGKTVKVKIIHVIDGDTVIARTVKNSKMKIRLIGIDAPEKNQQHGKDSKKYLDQLISSKIVSVLISNKDKYRRHLGTIFIGKINVNLELVKSGNAWAYRKYLKKMNKKTEEAYVRAESLAQFKKIGLWKESSPIPPWKWRKNKY